MGTRVPRWPSHLRTERPLAHDVARSTINRKTSARPTMLERLNAGRSHVHAPIIRTAPSRSIAARAFGLDEIDHLRAMRRTLLVVLVVLNAVVLLGQLWPEGAPPFARAVNIVFLVAVLGYLMRDLLAKR